MASNALARLRPSRSPRHEHLVLCIPCAVVATGAPLAGVLARSPGMVAWSIAAAAALLGACGAPSWSRHWLQTDPRHPTPPRLPMCHEDHADPVAAPGRPSSVPIDGPGAPPPPESGASIYFSSGDAHALTARGEIVGSVSGPRVGESHVWSIIDDSPPAPPLGCGDGVRSGGEVCDNGSGGGRDGCTPNCECERGWDCTSGAPTPVAGDGVRVGSEACDDGNTIDGDGCGANGVVEARPAWCRNTAAGVASVCGTAPGCGDGFTSAPAESCDDANAVEGDGCTQTCVLESGWALASGGAVVPVCGDGVVIGPERNGGACDDGNQTAGDGCDATCNVESGYSCSECSGSPSRCTSGCGDGTLAATEECDDGGAVDGDGCSRHCRIEAATASSAPVGPFLTMERRDGALDVRILAGCGPDHRCTADDLQWVSDRTYFWLPDLESLARATVSLVYDPETSRLGLAARVAPLLRRILSGGFLLGLGFSYADLGGRQHFTVTSIYEYDLSYLVRRELGGRGRRLHFSVGAEFGLALLGAGTPFGQAIVFAAAIDPYAELRILPTPDVAIPIRAGANLAIGRDVFATVEVSAGLGVLW